MHINVFCPSCQQRFQLDPSLEGTTIYCPNSKCRKVFVVQKADDEQPSSPSEELSHPELEQESSRKTHYSGSVGDFIPILQADAVENFPTEHNPPVERKSPFKQEESNWKNAPPPVRQPGRRTPGGFDPTAGLELVPDRPATSSPLVPAPRAQVPASSRGHNALEITQGPRELGYEEETFGEPSKRWRARWAIIGLILTVGMILAAGSWLVWNKVAHFEEDRSLLAREEFDQAQYAKAAKSFSQLAADFPESPRFKEYLDMEGLCLSLQPVYEISSNKKEVLAELLRFLDDQGKEPLFRQQAKAILDALDKLSEVLADHAQQLLNPPPNIARARDFLQEARRAQAESSRFRVDETNTHIAALLGKVDAAIAKAQKRQDVLNILQNLPARAEAIDEGMKLVDREGLVQDPEAKQILDRLGQIVLSQIGYTVVGEVLGRTPDAHPEQTLVVVAPLKDNSASADSGPGIAFAVARGVLYALTKNGGKLAWACRVGLDSNYLPVRLAAGETHPEIALVISEKTQRLSAREVLTGLERWHYDLDGTCAGRPVIVGTRAYLPAVDGKIHEIDIVAGHLLGWFQLNARLSTGGTYHEGTGYLYFPADSLQVYVLDPQRRQCVGILQTGHGAGSLRSEPLVVGAAAELAPAGMSSRPHYLILTQTDGLGATKLRAYGLAGGSGVQTLRMEAEVGIPGWTWFRLRCDGEKIALATDAGTFGLFGINQIRNDDAAIFRFVPEDYQFGSPLSAAPLGRAQVVHAEENDFWVLAGGKLHHIHLTLDRQKGLVVKKRWRQGIALGWPLHAAEVDERHGMLFVVTQDESACLATAVEENTGRVIWQQRLGLISHGNPLAIGDLVMVQDSQGTLASFQANSKGPKTEPVRSAEGRVLSGPLKKAEAIGLVPSLDGLSAYSLVAGAGRIHVRQFLNGAMHSKDFPLAGIVAGTLGIGPDFLVMPLADGSLFWQSWNGKTQFASWRSVRAPRNAVGHVLVVGPDAFLCTDGFRSLVRWRCLPGQPLQEEKSLEFSDRLVGAPVALPNNRIGVADAGGTVTVLNADDLQKIRQWQVNGKVTTGPISLGPYLSCVVDSRRLLWMDLNQETMREYTAQSILVGQPRMLGNGIWVAEVTGRIIVVDSQTQKPRGEPFLLPEGAALSSSPVPLGSGHVFLALTDGTAISLPVDADR